MPRKKITARKTTGGPARCIRLRFRDKVIELSSNTAVSQGAADELETPDVEMADNIVQVLSAEDNSDVWCCICGNGGMVTICDGCESATCTTCIPGLAEFRGEAYEDYSFKCLGCTGQHNIFYGIFKPDGSPVFPRGMPVVAHNSGGPLKRRAKTPRIVIIELILEELKHGATSGSLLYKSVIDFYKGTECRIHHELIYFNVDPEEVERHGLMMQRITEELEERNFDHVFLIIHTHSDDDRGDLWFHKDLEGTSTNVTNFFDNVVGEHMCKYIARMKFSAFFLLSCGAVVNVQESFSKLCDTIERLRFVDSFAFGAENLLTHKIAYWMQSYHEQVIHAGQNTSTILKSLLYTSNLGRHTSVVHFNGSQFRAGKSNKLQVSQYFWEHPFQRPNGYTYPICCPECCMVYPWKKVRAPADGSAFTLVCNNTVTCPGRWDVPATPDSCEFDATYVGNWRLKQLDRL